MASAVLFLNAHSCSVNYPTLLATLIVFFGSALRSQCSQPTGQSIVPLMAPTGSLPIDDEGRSVDLAFLGFAFPIGGGASYSHFVVESNGEVYLTDGTGVVDPATFGVSNLAELRGAPSSSPRVMALSGDLQAAPWHNNWDVLVDDTVAGQVKVTWVAVRYFASTKTYGMSVTLFSTGSVQFDYEHGDFQHVLFAQFAGISAGNAVGTGLEAASDLNANADSGALALLFENSWLPFDLCDQSIVLTPNGSGGYVAAVACGLSRHESYGAGCYDIGFESVYHHFTDAAVASATLSGNTLALAPTTNGHVALWLVGASSMPFVPPTAAATQLPVGNDGEVTHVLAAPFPLPSGPIDKLTVQGNGILAFGPGPVEPWQQNYLPQPARMVAGSHGGVYCWHAYNEDEGGDVWVEYVAGVTCVTFLDVENFPLGVANPSTFQVQFEHATGMIFIVFVHIDSDNSLVWGNWPQDHVIGFTPPGGSVDPGAVDFTTQLPWVTTPDVRALQLSASPDPVSTTTAGTTVVYTIDHALPLAPGGAVFGVLALTTLSSLPVDLVAIGAAGCFAHVGSLAVTLDYAGPSGPQTIAVALPRGIPPGTRLFAQAAVLAIGANASGMITSNGLDSTISTN